MAEFAVNPPLADADDRPHVEDNNCEVIGNDNMMRNDVIVISTIAGETFTINISLSKRVADLQLQLFDLRAIPQENQRLFLKRNLLSDLEMKLSDYGVSSGDTIYLTIRSESFLSILNS